MSHTPQLLNVASISLTPEQLTLAERVAQQAQALWTQEPRPLQGDCAAVKTILKVLLALGYRIESAPNATALVSPSAIATGSTASRDLASAELPDIALALNTLKESSDLNLASLLTLQRQTIKLRPQSPSIYRALGEAILQIGEPLMAYDVLAEGLKPWPNDLRLQQLLALALARSGSTVAANTLLTCLVEHGHQDEETVGLLARTHKDLWTQALAPEEAARHLRLAAQRYQQAYDLTGSIWVGINAATMACLMNHLERAQELAQVIKQSCLDQLAALDQGCGDPYWLLATLGEAALILKDWAAAEAFYGEAIAQGQGRFGDFSSSRRNALLLGQHLDLDLGRIKQWFHIPQVVVFCGHRIDTPDRPHPRFPPELEPKVYEAIRDRLLRIGARFGYASAACGADILFLEALHSLQGELHIVLPYNQKDFVEDAVRIRPDGQWEKRFERVMGEASEVVVTSQHKMQQSPVVYDYSNRLLHGLAKIRAEQLGTDLVPLTVWDGQPGNGSRGTASTVSQWHQWSEAVEVVDLAALLKAQPLHLPSPSTPSAQTAPSEDASDQALRALLFADVVNYTRLSEAQFFPFADHFLGAVARLLDASSYRPLMRNTWGDAIYMVFATVEHAGQAALDLCDLVQQANWSEKGLPADLNLRIALHAGPVSSKVDPLTGQANYVGTHVNHTARIEPITPPGKVYASQAFAAIASSEGQTSFSCDYVGQMPWAKHYGTFPTYNVRRARSASLV
ncbi:MAG: TRAFs-binding domain-containing protein [Elainellaceae cyanobacterium]